PSGMGAGNYGAAFVLGSTTSDFANSGSGYALLIGNTSTPDPFRIYRFNNGLAAVALTSSSSGPAGAPIAAGGPANTTGAGVNVTDYWSVKVTYDQTTNNWSLSTRDDGT